MSDKPVSELYIAQKDSDEIIVVPYTKGVVETFPPELTNTSKRLKAALELADSENLCIRVYMNAYKGELWIEEIIDPDGKAGKLTPSKSMVVSAGFSYLFGGYMGHKDNAQDRFELRSITQKIAKDDWVVLMVRVDQAGGEVKTDLTWATLIFSKPEDGFKFIGSYDSSDNKVIDNKGNNLYISDDVLNKLKEESAVKNVYQAPEIK